MNGKNNTQLVDGLKKSDWNLVKEKISKEGKSLEYIKSYFAEVMKREIEGKDITHIYKRLLQNKYTYEGKRVLVKGDIIYCEDLEFGNGIVETLFEDSTLMLVKFIRRDLPTMCDRKTMTTVHDDIKRKLKLKG